MVRRLRFASLGSGSEGNALIIEAHSGGTVTRVMLDCGFGIREMERRLEQFGVAPEGLDAILVTHEHGDHIGGAPRLARKYQVPLWMTHGTLTASGAIAAESNRDDRLQVRLIDHHARFSIGNLEVLPFPVPHDAREPAQFVFFDGVARLGVLTDLGSSTQHVESMLAGCDGLVLECNHDQGMLAGGSYPASLKARVGGRYGHLDNDQAAALLRSVRHDRLQHVIAAHLSQQNNTPALAQEALAAALGCAPGWVGIADQAEGFAWREL